MKIQLIVGKVDLRFKGKILLGVVIKLFVDSLPRKNCDSNQQCFAEKNKDRKIKCSQLLEGDEIKSRPPFKLFCTSFLIGFVVNTL